MVAPRCVVARTHLPVGNLNIVHNATELLGDKRSPTPLTTFGLPRQTYSQAMTEKSTQLIPDCPNANERSAMLS